MKKNDPYKPHSPLTGGAVHKPGKPTKGYGGQNPRDYLGEDKKK